MMVASVVPSPLAGPALARPVCTRLLPPCDLPAGPSLQSASGCRVARGGARRPQHISFAAGGGAAGDAFVVEGATNVKFSRELTVPGHKEPLIILGTGYRDKFFVKVYAAAFYVDISIGLDTEQWRKKVGLETFDASSGFDSIFKDSVPCNAAPVVKSLNITLVRDVDGNTFVKALDGVIARRIQKRTDEEESSLSAFRNSFLGRNLKKGTTIYLTWLEPSRMLVSVSTDQGPSQVDAEVKSATVNYALYDGFFGSSPVSPTLRSSTAQLLEAILTK
ncbi:fatty-acid-binding protein 3, chloroplastic isoform X1 [Triticum urartu]|uniref:fatty-acid-binding protein 3, chloroplastic isoform X1 n=1 Tax=Triticum urartu TaxID=4572 RepID=UPI0020441DDB|nr:fatty-acid-binding protein 3, chloroplastic isoform X1 [Triticum urartu]